MDIICTSIHVNNTYMFNNSTPDDFSLGWFKVLTSASMLLYGAICVPKLRIHRYIVTSYLDLCVFFFFVCTPKNGH